MTKLLQINVAINYGSTGKIAEQIGALVMERGWESYIAHGRYINSSRSHSIQVGDKTGWIFHAIMTRLFDRHGLFSTRATRRLVKQIEEIKPDIIHLHNIHGYYINYKVLFNYLRKANIPVVWTLHDCWPMTGHCAHFVYAKCQKWKRGCFDCPEQKSYPKSKFFDRSRRNYIEKRAIFNSVKNLTIVPVSKWLGSIVKESFLKERDVEVIYNGVDVNTFKPIADNDIRERYGIPSHKKIILGAATAWSPNKGFDDFVKLYDILPKEEIQIVLIGLTQYHKNQLPEGVIGLYRTEDVEELAKWYSVADVFANLSKAETFGLTTAEALASGTPAIVYNNTASPELVTSEVGQVVDNDNIEAVAQAVEALCAEDREAMRSRCREYALARFDKEDSYRKYIELYEKLINKTK